MIFILACTVAAYVLVLQGGAYVILSDSMRPNISAGSMVFTSERPAYRSGQVVVFERDGTYVVHRITEIQDNCIQTKGDANTSGDPGCLLMADIQGLVVGSVPYLGGFLLVLHEILIPPLSKGE